MLTFVTGQRGHDGCSTILSLLRGDATLPAQDMEAIVEAQGRRAGSLSNLEAQKETEALLLHHAIVQSLSCIWDQGTRTIAALHLHARLASTFLRCSIQHPPTSNRLTLLYLRLWLHPLTPQVPRVFLC